MIEKYKTQIAIVIGSIIISFALYYSMTAEYRNKLKICVESSSRVKTKENTENRKEWCEFRIARFGRW